MRSDHLDGRPAAGAVLLTGATGFLGMELLLRYLQRSDRRVYALVRAGSQEEANGRLGATVASLLGDPGAFAERLVALPGDVERPGLGLDRRRRDELAAEVGEIVHAAASVSFTLPLARARAINVEGTRRMLELADRCAARGSLRRFAHVSTAYVAGTCRGDFAEAELDVGQRFHNSYERSKFEAERLVRARAGELPVQVVRPSIVVGESDTGWTPAFNVIYTPLRAFASGAYPVVPARRSAPVDAVPVDYVADAIFALAALPDTAGATYHLAAGPAASTVGELIDLAAARLGRPAPRTLPPSAYRRLVHPLLLRRSSGARRRFLQRSEAFFPYFALGVRYDTSGAEAVLGPTGISVPPLASYFDRLLDFAEAARWGARRVARADVAPAREMRLGGAARPRTAVPAGSPPAGR